ncbi:MAG: multiple sugar transport system substrate-binding protein [Frankiaceae bacterium]|jgi:ABC-type glycerol-3-phosphate transport system substrate-binding protein|nr:multiple sugar transport system substrate-binding protein [Frankiaceae bacterium]
MQMRAKVIRAALAMVAALVMLTVAACGGGSNNSKSTSSGPSGTPAKGGKVTLNAIFLPATWGTVVKDTLAPEYERETGVKVNVQLIARDAIHDKMATLFAAKDSSFDIFNLDYNWIPEFGGAGQLVPMDDMVSAADRQDFFPLTLKVATWQGKLYGIPQTIHPALLWYRKDLYGDPKIQTQFQAETGQKLEAPKTMAEWLQQAKFFNGKTFHGKKTYGWAAQAAKGFGNVHTWLSFLYTYGGHPFNGDFTKSTLSSPQGEQATAQWAEMMKYMPPGANGFTYDNVTTAAQQGTIATALQWSWGAFAVDDKKSSKTVGDWEYTQVPAVTAGQVSHPHLAEWVIAVSKYSKHAVEAKKFAAWLETKKNDVVQASLGGGDPVRQSSYSNVKLTKDKVPGTNVLRFRRLPQVIVAMKNAMPRPFFAGEERWETTVTTPLQAVSLGKESPAQGLTQSDKAVDASLQR